MQGTDADILFSHLAPVGYYLALRVGFAFPIAEHNALPAEWVDHYTLNGFMLHDPVIRWLYQNQGSARWSAIDVADPRGVMQAARGFGLTYGVSIVCTDPADMGHRSFGSFVRADREFEDQEIGLLSRTLRVLHAAKAPPQNLTRAEIEALRLMRDGLLVKEIALRLGVSEGAVKQRLKNAKAKLGARTNGQVISKAQGFGLL